MRIRQIQVFLFAVMLCPGMAAEYAVAAMPTDLVERLKLNSFYQKYTSANGLPVVASEKVADNALREAAYLIDQMLGAREDVRQAMISNRVRFAVMAPAEFTTMLPEQADMNPAKYWDKRARGLGASRRRPVVSCGEENLLGYPGDPYRTENILIHEFAHAIHGLGLRSVDRTFDQRLRAAYADAKKRGLWKGTYAAVDAGEYWAEAVQSWFETNRENDAQHNHVNTRAELKEYDPAVAELVKEVFGDRPWIYKKPAERPAEENAHLKEFSLGNAPKFEWPKELIKWNQEYAASIDKPESELLSLPLLKIDAQPISEPVTTLRDSSILFMNQRSSPVVLYHLDGKGERKRQRELAAGERRRLATFVGQTWLVTEGDKTLGLVVASFEPAKAAIE